VVGDYQRSENPTLESEASLLPLTLVAQRSAVLRTRLQVKLVALTSWAPTKSPRRLSLTMPSRKLSTPPKPPLRPCTPSDKLDDHSRSRSGDPIHLEHLLLQNNCQARNRQCHSHQSQSQLQVPRLLMTPFSLTLPISPFTLLAHAHMSKPP
jgi:hypothetical protein